MVISNRKCYLGITRLVENATFSNVTVGFTNLIPPWGLTLELVDATKHDFGFTILLPSLSILNSCSPKSPSTVYPRS